MANLIGSPEVEDRGEQLDVMTRRLIGLVANEITALREHRLSQANADWDEKERLVHAWRLEVSRIKADPSAAGWAVGHAQGSAEVRLGRAAARARDSRACPCGIERSDRRPRPLHCNRACVGAQCAGGLWSRWRNEYRAQPSGIRPRARRQGLSIKAPWQNPIMGFPYQARYQQSVSKCACHAMATIQRRALHARQACMSRFFYA